MYVCMYETNFFIDIFFETLMCIYVCMYVCILMYVWCVIGLGRRRVGIFQSTAIAIGGMRRLYVDGCLVFKF